MPPDPAISTQLINGIPSSVVEIGDRGFQYGDGIFTTLSIRQSIPLFLADHLQRLERDALALKLPTIDRRPLLADIRMLCADRASGVLKIQLTRGVGGRGYRPAEVTTPTRVVSVFPPPDYPASYSREGVSVRFCQTRLGMNPFLAGAKHTNRLEQVLARMEWPATGEQEGIMVDAAGHVTEGTMTNLFLVEGGGRLVTPTIDTCGVLGVMRGLMIEAASDLGLSCTEERVTPERLLRAKELLLTNSLIGIWPIRLLAGVPFAVGTVTAALIGWLEARIARELTTKCIA
jgi:4-amino-4-deoxychorismate lyase